MWGIVVRDDYELRYGRKFFFEFCFFVKEVGRSFLRGFRVLF